MANLCRRQQ